MLVTEIHLEIGDGSSQLLKRSSEVVSYSKQTVKLNMENKLWSDCCKTEAHMTSFQEFFTQTCTLVMSCFT